MNSLFKVFLTLQLIIFTSPTQVYAQAPKKDIQPPQVSKVLARLLKNKAQSLSTKDLKDLKAHLDKNAYKRLVSLSNRFSKGDFLISRDKDEISLQGQGQSLKL